MIELIQLNKTFGAVTAVQNLSLVVHPGEVFACLGPNGAGKTTTIKMMMGLLRPTAGSVRLGGYDLADAPEAAKRLCGFVPDRPFLYDKLTGAEFLDFVAGLYGVEEHEAAVRRQQLLEQFDLAPWADELTESYSHGMKQRLALAAALIHDPQILVLDEPMVGLDPRGALLLKRLVRHLARRGATVFFSTHSLDVAEEIADRIGIIDQGRLIALGTLSELQRLAGSPSGADLEAIFLRLTTAERGSDVPLRARA
ncbi:MAG: ABC transporter ATP-binding protein [Candidatus Binatia bacterium]|nr:ABC transporter ATP-binding protein [Candidatus Binatia bacterium]